MSLRFNWLLRLLNRPEADKTLARGISHGCEVQLKRKARGRQNRVAMLSTFLVLNLAVPLPTFAQEKITVVVTGFGDTAQSAEKDALRRAVRSAVGSYVDSETLIQNDKLIRDRILEATGSYVTHFKTISTKKRGGLIEMEIQAVVEGGQVAKALEAANLVQRGVSTKNLVAEITGKIENAREGSKILQRNLPPDLLQKLLVARLVDFEGEPTDQIEPKRKVLDDGRVETTWMVQTYFDNKQFYENFVPPLHQLLSGIATAHGGPVMSVGKTKVDLPLNGYPVHFYRDWQGAAPKQPTGDQKHCYIVLSTGRSADGGTERWNWYLLEGADYIKALKKITMQKSYAQVQLKAEFLAADGGVVANTSISPWEKVVWCNSNGYSREDNPAPLFLNMSGTLGKANRGKPLAQHMVISTRFCLDYSGGLLEYPSYAVGTAYPSADGGACDIMMRPFTVTLAPEDLRRIVNVRFYFTLSDSL